MFTSDLIKHALREDIGEGDVTSEAVIPSSLMARGVILAKEAMTVAGLGVAGGVFSSVDPSLTIDQSVKEGSRVKPGTELMVVEGNARSLLKAERVALNFLQRLCGIATQTRLYVDQVQGEKTKILDTRKTNPLMRHLDKYAVRMGGGFNHRFGLYDAIMLKDNHIAAVHGSIEEAVKQARSTFPDLPVIVEVTELDQLASVLKTGAQRVLLDNMTDENIQKAMENVAGKLEVEVSGGVTLERIKTLSRLGVDFISVGALTHSVKASDVSFEITPQ